MKDTSKMTLVELVSYGNELKGEQNDFKSEAKETGGTLSLVNQRILDKFRDAGIPRLEVHGVTTFLRQEASVRIVDMEVLLNAALNGAEPLRSEIRALLTFNATSMRSHIKEAYLAHPSLKNEYIMDRARIPAEIRDAFVLGEATTVQRKGMK